MSRLTRWLVNGLVVAVTVVVSLAAVELGIRAFYPQPMGGWHQDRDGLALHWPGLVTYLPQSGFTVSFNAAGMRDVEHAVQKAPGVLRVLVLGDSFMEALQVRLSESFPSLLQGELAERVPGGVEVINASVSGWGTDDELKYLTSYGHQFKPDLVIVAMTLYNDINDNLRERFHTVRDGALVEKTGTGASYFQYKIIQLKGLLASRFQAYQLLIRARRAKETRVEASQLSTHVNALFAPADDRIVKGLELTQLLLDRIRAMTVADGGRVVLMLIPLGVQLSDSQFAEFAASVGEGGTSLKLDRPQQQVKRIAERSGVPVIDLLPAFREWAASGGADLYLSRDGHWDRPGHRLAARAAVSELVRLGLTKR